MSIKETSAHRVLILGPPRSGATSLRSAFNRLPKGIAKAEKCHVYSSHERQKCPPDQVETVILIYREPIDRYISLFFHTCTVPDYPYYFGTQDEVKSATTQQLIDHFKKFDWSQFSLTNYNYYVDVLNHYFGIPIIKVVNFIHSDLKYQSLRGHHIDDSGQPQMGKSVNCILLKTHFLDQSVKKLNSITKLKIDHIPHHKTSTKAWYSQKYQDFKTQFFSMYKIIRKDEPL
jgi:hypothetical protein